MATEAGIISALIGTATATAVDGTVRNLQVGDKVYPNEIITTGLAGAIEIEFPDGSVMDLGRNSQAVLDSETFEFDVAAGETPEPAADVVDDIEAIQQALLAGEDPTQIADATAAGPGAQPTSEGGSDAVVVDYLAPRVTPDSGFETTGPGVDFLDPPPFEFLVDESDDLDPVDPIDTPPPPPETSSNAPTLLMSVGNEQFTIGSTNLIRNGSFENIGGPEALLESNPTTGKDNATNQFIGMGDNAPDSLSGTKFLQMTSMEGWTLSDGSAPMEPHAKGHAGVGTSDGDHYMDLGGSPGDISIQQQVSGLTAGASYQLSVDYLDKAAKQEAGASGQRSGVLQVMWNGEVIATIDGNNRSEWLTFSNVVIAGSGDGSNTLVLSEVGENADNWGMAVDNVQLVPITYQYDLSIAAGMLESETGDQLGLVSLSASSLPDGVSIVGLTPNGDGFYEIDASEKVVLTLTSNKQLTAEDINKISGSVTLTSEDTSSSVSETAYAELTGQSTDDELIGTDANEMIIGDAGDDILTGGAGKDIFVWNDGDQGTSITPANDTVTDFNIAEGDVLDFSDILVGEDSGSLTDFISITEDGSDIVIELKPDAGDVTQTVTLQGKSLTDLGLGGFDTSTQQAEMINKLVQEGHVNVDS
jgi:hypothetical protein